MRAPIIAVAFLVLGLTSAAAQPVPRRTVDLDAPGALTTVEQTNPGHAAKIRAILRDVLKRPGVEVPRWLQASFDARDVSYAPVVLTSHPPKRRLSFALDDTRYVTVITLANVDGAIVPLK